METKITKKVTFKLESDGVISLISSNKLITTLSRTDSLYKHYIRFFKRKDIYSNVLMIKQNKHISNLIGIALIKDYEKIGLIQAKTIFDNL